MRLMRITNNYPAYLEKFYRNHPLLADQSYSIQYRALMDDCFGWADFWTQALRPLGYEVWETVGNAELQQKAWARENGVEHDDNNWQTQILTAQVKQFRPDVLFLTEYHAYKRWFLDRLRKAAPSIRVIIGWCGAPYVDADVFHAYDLVLSNIASFVERFREDGHRSELMHHAFEPRILDKIQMQSGRTVPFSFVGSVVKSKAFHNERESLLRHLVRDSPLHIWGDLQTPGVEEYRQLLSLKNKYVALRRLQKAPGGTLLARVLPQFRRLDSSGEPDLSTYVTFEIVEKAQSGVYGLAMYQVLRDSQVTFNNHIDASAQFANNLRLYEATGVGTCLLTDWKENLGTLFELDSEVVSYRCADEAVEKVQYLLTHDEERRRIGEAGQRRTLRDHTFSVRAEQLHEIIRRLSGDVSQNGAGKRSQTPRFSELPVDTPLLVVDPSLRDRLGWGPSLSLPEWGLELRRPAEPLVWLGQGEKDGLHATIWSEATLDVVLSAHVAPGPARPDGRRTLRFSLITDAGEQVIRQTFDGDAIVPSRMKLEVGANHLGMEVLDVPTTHPPNDSRPLLVQLLRLDVTAFDGLQLGPPGRPLVTLSLRLVQKAQLDPRVKTPGWSIESDAVRSWLWLGSGEDQGVAVTVNASEATPVTFGFDVRPGPARPDQDRTLEFRLENDKECVTQTQRVSGPSRITFKGTLRRGPNTFQLLVHEPPTLNAPGDNRPLLLCVTAVTLDEEGLPQSIG